MAEAEKHHVTRPILMARKLQAMRNKQAVHSGDRSHPELVAVSRLCVTTMHNNIMFIINIMPPRNNIIQWSLFGYHNNIII